MLSIWCHEWCHFILTSVSYNPQASIRPQSLWHQWHKEVKDVKMIHFFFFCCLSGNEFCLSSHERGNGFVLNQLSIMWNVYFCPGVCLSFEVHQSPSDIITKPDAREQISCSHDKTDHRLMLWYQRSPGDTALKLIGYLNYQSVTMEEPYKDNFTISGDLSGDKAKKVSLITNVTGFEHTAVYYCATSRAHWRKSPFELNKNTRLFFINGLE